jgi:hypothetical protein
MAGKSWRRVDPQPVTLPGAAGCSRHRYPRRVDAVVRVFRPLGAAVRALLVLPGRFVVVFAMHG